MLDALRGKGGGYRLAKAPEDYSVYDILCLTEGTLAPVTCLEAGQSCENAGACSTYPLWQGLDETVRKYLSGFTLVDVLNMKKPRIQGIFPTHFVGVDAHIDPRARANSPGIFVKSVYTAGSMWASTPTQGKES